MEAPLYPTAQQEARCFILCQSLTSMFVPIYIVRLDERRGSIFILAGDEIAIVIERNGKWGFEE
jgi:hypothetical protein